MFPVSNHGRDRGGISAFRCLLISTSAFATAALLAANPGLAQTALQPGPAATTPSSLPRIDISGRRPKSPARSKKSGARTAARPARHNGPGTAGPVPPAEALTPVQTPLNSNAVATSASRLGLTVLQTPATVEVVDQKTIQDQGYRTTTDTAQGAVGVLAGDAGGAPANFSMRGFTGSQVNTLYNGIWTGPSDITSRWMETANLAQVEFLKGPSSIMTGLNAVGGAVNYVNRQPTTGPIQSELDVSSDSYGSILSHYGSGGSTGMKGLDYRFDAAESKLNSFIDGDFRDFTDLAGQLNYHATNNFMVFGAVEYKKDSGHAYWGTPLVPTAFAGPNAVSGVVSGAAASTFFSGYTIAPVTIDSRTLTTNYNVADNATGAQELWLRSGFEWTPLNNVTVKDQYYYYQAKRNWIDSETYGFDDGMQAGSLGTNVIDRDRFAVSHNQHIIGNNADFTWDSQIFGMDNRFAAQLQVSRNWITFTEDLEGGYPQDAVAVVNPAPDVYGPISADTRISRLTDIAESFEDRLKITPAFALIAGVRIDELFLDRSGTNFDGSTPGGLPFSTTWMPVSYRGAYTYEPIRDLVFYSMYATAYDPAVAAVFSVNPNNGPVSLTSSRIYETGVKHKFWDDRAEWTFSAYDITQRNVYVPVSTTVDDVAGEIVSKGIEVAGAVRPIDGLKLWGNAAWTQARFTNFDVWTGNAPPNVAPIIINAGASYRFDHWQWPVEFGGAVRHVGNRFLAQDNLTTMDSYTTADVYSFVDIPGRDVAMPELKTLRLTFRVRNLTNAVYAQWSDPGLPNQILLGTPRTYEVAASAKW